MRNEESVSACRMPSAWQLSLLQRPQGYRFSLDAFLLADFVLSADASPLIDLGTGSGVVALLLARCIPQGHIVGAELQPSLATLAQQNVQQNGLRHRVDIVQADVRRMRWLFAAGAFATVVCNPPYREVGQGRLNPNPEKAMARHELALTLAQMLDAARHLLRRHGRLVMVYHPSRLAELCAGLEKVRLRPRRMRLVHSTLHIPASMVLIEAVCDGRDALVVLPPLYVYEAAGVYSPEMQAIFQGRALSIRNAERGMQNGRIE